MLFLLGVVANSHASNVLFGVFYTYLINVINPHGVHENDRSMLSMFVY